MPNIVQELSPVGIQSRLSFQTPDDRTRILLLSNRFEYSLQATVPNGESLGDLADFCANAANTLTGLLNHLQLVPFRLAVVQEGHTARLQPEHLQVIAEQLLRFPQTYHQPAEWDWRCLARIIRQILTTEEPLNYITTIRRSPGEQTPTTIMPTTDPEPGHLRVDFDINTSNTYFVPRFDISTTHAFFKQVSRWHQELSTETFRFINGEA